MTRAIVSFDVKVFARKRQAKLNPLAFTLMVKAMRERERTVQELQEITGLSLVTLRDYCKTMVVHQEAHIAGWEKDTMGRDCNPRYRLGFGINVPREVRDKNFKRNRLRAMRAREAAIRKNQELRDMA